MAVVAYFGGMALTAVKIAKRERAKRALPAFVAASLWPLIAFIFALTSLRSYHPAIGRPSDAAPFYFVTGVLTGVVF